MHTPPWFVLGAGSIGCLFAAYLSRAGHAVTLILRDRNTVAELRRAGGIHLNLPDGDGARETVACSAISLEELNTTEQSLSIQRILVCTKAHQTLDAITGLRPGLDNNAQLILLQNGMGVRERIQPLLPTTTIAQAITTEGGWRRSAFEVVHAGRGETLVGDTRTAAEAEHIAASLGCALHIHADTGFASRQWLKLAVNCVINPLTGLRECRNGELLHQTDVASLTRRLCGELRLVAEACGQSLSQVQLEQTVFDVMRGTTANQSSMWQDLQRRRLTEIDFINGYVVRQGHSHGIDCPTHEALLRAIQQKEKDLGCA